METPLIPYISDSDETATTPIDVVDIDNFDAWLDKQPARHQNWISTHDFETKDGNYLTLPDDEGGISSVLLAKDFQSWDIWSLASLPASLPVAKYHLKVVLEEKQATDVAIGWALATYVFDRYKKSEQKFASLVVPENADRDHVERTVFATNLTRDLINIPAADMGPKALEAAASQIAGEFEARQTNVIGDDLITYHYPMVHAVGRASAQEPRVIDMVWGDPKAPKVTLIGKGVCFDTGGLDLKPSSAMLNMKKDMGGAAIVLGLAHMIMHAELPVRLRVLIPAVENSVSANAYRPGDILTSRSGKTVEIGNTDAEGRLVLADVITAADEDEPEILIDFATLTGAARVAVGTEIAASFTDDDDFYRDLERHAKTEKDPVWRLPLWSEYRSLIDSKVADINNSGSTSFAGATTAGLFLKEFVEKSKCWVHFDVMAYNTRARAGRPIGGDAFAARAVFALLKERYDS